MRNINKKILLIVTFMLTTFLIGCDWEKEVQGPIPYKSDSATKIDTNRLQTINGNYIVDNFTMSYTNTEVNIPTLMGGFVLYYDNKSVDEASGNTGVQFNYLTQYGGYPNIVPGNTVRTVKMDNLSNYEVLEDNYTIKFNTPITITDGDKTYTVNSIRKNDDNVIIIQDDTTVDAFPYRTICDPDLPIDNNNSKTCGLAGALKYIGAYRIESLKCADVTYTGGVDFAGEMVASPQLINAADVDLSIILKLQVQTEALKTCMLTTEDINNNNILYRENKYTISGQAAANLSAVFAQVGLLSLKGGDATERTTQIDYLPKDANYDNATFNGNNVQMRLRIMRTGELSKGPVINLDSTTPYFSAN